jgi:hypothetical protein
MLHKTVRACRKIQNTFAATFMKKLAVERESSVHTTKSQASVPLTISSEANFHMLFCRTGRT